MIYVKANLTNPADPSAKRTYQGDKDDLAKNLPEGWIADITSEIDLDRKAAPPAPPPAE